MRTALIIIFRVALVVAAASLGYLLFVFGHTELTPHWQVVVVASVGAFSSLVAGILQWVGLPALPPKQNAATAGRRRSAR